MPEFEKLFWEQGYAVVEGLFQPAEMAGVMESVLAHYKTAPPANWNPNFLPYETLTDSWTPQAPENGPFDAFARHPKLAELTAQLLGDDFAAQSCLMMQTRPGTGQAWHQDTSCVDPAKFILNRILYPWAYPPEAGTIILVPGSHRRGRIPPGPNHEPIPGELKLQPKPGTLVFLHSFTFHRVGINRWNSPRHTLNFRSRPASCPPYYDSVGFYRSSAYDFGRQEVLDL